MNSLTLDQVADKHVTVRRVFLAAAGCLLCVYAVAGSGTVRERFVLAVVAIFMMLFGFWAVRLILGFQVALHGMKPFVRTFCAFFFWFFAFCAMWSIAVAPFHVDLWAVSAIGCLGWSLGALMTYVRYRSVQPKR
jgi:hypothetical protein